MRLYPPAGLHRARTRIRFSAHVHGSRRLSPAKSQKFERGKKKEEEEKEERGRNLNTAFSSGHLKLRQNLLRNLLLLCWLAFSNYLLQQELTAHFACPSRKGFPCGKIAPLTAGRDSFTFL